MSAGGPGTHVHVQACAKLNLMLHVLAREQSGFHQIETLFCAIELADEIDVRLHGDGVLLDVRSADDDPRALPDLGPVEKNLAYRAALLFADAAGRAAAIAPGVQITLTKRIPAGAGLGGGSSDAAAVLRALNALHGSPLSAQALLKVGAGIGSDVPFFLSEAPLALAWGRGGRLLPLPSLTQAHVLLAAPDEGVPTADAYSALSHSREAVAADGRDAAAAFGLAPSVQAVPSTWRDVADVAHNDFEDVVFQRLPQLGMLRQAIEDHGATLARMTGTGSVVFGVFEDERRAQHAAERMAAEFPDVALTLTRTR